MKKETRMDYVAFSGGKDSTALALSMPKAIPVFTDTQWEHAELYEHIDKFEQKTGRKVERINHPKYTGGLPEYIKEKKFFPNHGARYCTRIFKIESMNAWLEDKLPATLNIGLRADEPESIRVGNLSEIKGLTISYPLRTNGTDVLGVIRICLENELLPRYPIYMAGGGCIGCFFKTKGQVLSFIHQAPKDEVNNMKLLEEEIQDKRGRYFYAYGNAGMSISDIQKQPLLMDDKDVFAELANQKFCGAFCGK